MTVNLPLRGVALWMAMFAGFFALIVLVYRPYLNMPLLYDDVATLLYMQRPQVWHWWDAFLPMGNGFIRPTCMLVMTALFELWPLQPLPMRLFAAGVHAAVAVTAVIVFRQITGAGWLSGLAAGLSILLASTAFVAVFYFTNSCDSMMGLGLLVCIGCYHQWLSGGGRHWLAGMAGGLLAALMGKETGVVAAGAVVLMAWNSRASLRRAWLPAAAVVIACGLCAAGIIYVQRQNQLSYGNQGYMEQSAADVGTRLLSYLAATIFPGSFVMEPLWGPGRGWSLVNGMLRMLAGIALVAALWAVARRRADMRLRMAAVLYSIAAGSALPAALLILEAGPHSPIGRYIYTAMVLVIMSLGCLLVWLYEKIREWTPGKWIWRAAVLAWLIWFAIQPVILRLSPGVHEYLRASREWGNFIESLGTESAKWAPMQAVTVYTGEPHGSLVLSEPYGMAIFRVYYPDLLANYVGNRIAPETTMEYVFDGTALHRLK